MNQLEIGIVTLALIHANKIKINCEACDEYQKEQLCCSGVAEEIPVFEIDEYEYYSCPLKFIDSLIAEFYTELSYYELFPGSAPKYGDHNDRFYAAVRLYKSVYNKYAYETKSKDSTDKSLSELRKNFKR